ncbi:MAG: hypothetical protein KDA68_10625 [Planctomycetaceae bacterium]|nr:hypothetical protein [Planctomycetaceae bacterium]
MRNSIEAVIGRSKFVEEKHLLIQIDGISLDEVLDRFHPEKEICGLIPAWLDWMESPADRSETLRRLTASEADFVVPLLMCPDDLDFSCSLIVAEVRQEKDCVWWNRVGMNRQDLWGFPEQLGKDVEWFEAVPPFEFEKTEYKECVRSFLDQWRDPALSGL